MIYEEVFRSLQKNKIRYVVVGGMAVNFHHIVRQTADLDLIVQLEDGENVRRFVMALGKLGYKPRVPVNPIDFADPKKREQWRKEKGAKVFTFVLPNSYEQIDVFIYNPISFLQLFKRRKKARFGDIVIPVASLKDLKSLKQLANREKDRYDIQHIERMEKLNREK
jgi:predicted nucleotidyltransferase